MKRNKESKGILTLVDLAGSEWSRDQKDHNRKQQAQSRDINASLMTLKQCIRARVTKDIAAAAQKKIPNNPMPIREQKLTRLLKDCFVDAEASTVVIACVSPTSGDVEHTMESLRGGQGDMNKGSGWGMPPETLLSSNISGVAVLGEKDKSLAAAAVAGAVANDALSGDLNSLHPQNWTPSHICVWWTNTAEKAFHAAVKESQKKPETFTIEINASDAIAMKKECVCKLGMKFQREPTNKAPRVNDINSAGLVGRAIQLRKKQMSHTLEKGCVLVGIDDVQFDGTSNIHNQRKTILAAVKPTAMALGKAAAEWQAWASQGKTTPTPTDMTVVLTFQTAILNCPRMPAPIPNIFTGASRLGTSDGRQLCQEFGTATFNGSTLNQMSATGGSNSLIGTMFWNDLRRLMKERVVLKVVEEKKEQDKVDLQNCSPTRDVMYTYQQKKKTKETTKFTHIAPMYTQKAAVVEKDGIPAYQKLDIQYE